LTRASTYKCNLEPATTQRGITPTDSNNVKEQRNRTTGQGSPILAVSHSAKPSHANALIYKAMWEHMETEPPGGVLKTISLPLRAG
jgi:hypothetical protein